MTRVFKNCLEAVKEIERTLFEMGTLVITETMQDKQITKMSAIERRKFDTLEILGYDYKITNFDDVNKILEYLKLSKEYCEAEIADRLSSELENPGEAWKLRKDIWEEFTKKNYGRFSYTYNERIREQFDYIIRELKKNKNTRQAIISIWNPVIDIKKLGVDRVPCSMYYQFILRNDKLHLIYTQRSADFITHFGNDIWLAIVLLQIIAKETGNKIGEFHHFISSLHAYRKDMKEGIF